jgi:hypothetical protein
MNGEDVPFAISHWYDDHFQVMALDAVVPQNGNLCLYTPGGTYCMTEPRTYFPSISGEQPISAGRGQQVQLLGYNLFAIQSIAINGNEVSYENPNENIIIFTVPSDAVSGMLVVTTLNGSAGAEIVIPVEPCESSTEAWRESVEIIHVKLGTISNASPKNTNAGFSDYTDLSTNVTRFTRTPVMIKLKNFSTSGTPVRVEPQIIVEGTSDIVNIEFNLQQLNMAGAAETEITGWLKFPDRLADQTKLTLILKVTFGSMDPACINYYGEIERYSITIVEELGECEGLRVTAIDPQRAIAGEYIDVYGYNFSGITTVRVGNVFSEFAVLSDQKIRLKVPPTAVTAKVFVSTEAETVESPNYLLILQQQQITALEPVFGRAGDEIAILGKNIAGVAKVHFGEVVTMEYNVVSDSKILVKVPQGAVTAFVTLSERGWAAYR